MFESYVQAELDKRYSDIAGLDQGQAPHLGPARTRSRRSSTPGGPGSSSPWTCAIDRVAGLVADGLNEAKQLSADGRKQVDDAVNRLPPALRDVGREAAQSIGAKFDQLDQTITSKQDQLADTLAAKYQDGLKQLDDRITARRASTRASSRRRLSSVTGVISTILEMKNLLLKVLAKAVATIKVIIADPIGFLGNLVDAVGQGIRNFVGNILTHLKQGFFEWLFGEMAEGRHHAAEDLGSQGHLRSGHADPRAHLAQPSARSRSKWSASRSSGRPGDRGRADHRAHPGRASRSVELDQGAAEQPQGDGRRRDPELGHHQRHQGRASPG